jgi:hypothetical protein
MTHARNVIAVSGLLLALAPGASRAQLAEPRPAAVVSLGLLATAPGGPTFDAGSLTLPIAVGEKHTMSVVVKQPAAGADCDIAQSESRFQVGGAAAEAASHQVWEAEVEVRQASAAGIELQVDWRRFDPSRGPKTPAAGDSRRVTLHEGSYQLLDFHTTPRRAGCGYAGVGVKLSASLPEDARFQDRSLDYDLWLVHDGPGTERPWRISARHGEIFAFHFPAFVATMPGSRWADDGAEIAVKTFVQGRLQGRYRADGRVELSLSANRSFLVANNGGWGATEQGQKVVDVAPGEAIQLELPVLPLEAARQAQPWRAPQRGEEDVRAFLQTRKVALILKASPGW